MCLFVRCSLSIVDVGPDCVVLLVALMDGSFNKTTRDIVINKAHSGIIHVVLNDYCDQTCESTWHK
jgi:hypothetical protein